MRQLLFFLTVGLASPCLAQDPEPERGWYIGGGVSFTSVAGSSLNSITSDADNVDGATGLVVTAGYRLTDIIAVEFSYDMSDDVRFTTTEIAPCNEPDYCLIDAQQDTNTAMASALVILPIEPVEFFAKAGAAFWDASSNVRLTSDILGSSMSRQVSASGTNFVFGVGAGLDVSENTHLRFTVQLYGVDRELLAVNRPVSINELLFELHWRF